LRRIASCYIIKINHMQMNPVGEFRLADAEGATFHLAGGRETLRLQYHWGMHLWRAPAEAGHRRGKPLQG
jgi:hypothetical protein